MTEGASDAVTDAAADTAASAMPILETHGLTMRFGGVVAVDHVDFAMAEGELRCLIGPNGAGKSTFFKCLTHQYKASAGRVRFRGTDITGSHTYQIARRGIGIKTQVPSVFDGLSVHENIWVAARRHHGRREANQIVDEILERLRLSDLARRLVGQLAHGERQRVELGTVLTGEPELILLDEPTAGMTHEEVNQTTDLIREIHKTTSMIVVEHDMQFIKAIAKRVTVFHQGAIPDRRHHGEPGEEPAGARHLSRQAARGLSHAKRRRHPRELRQDPDPARHRPSGGRGEFVGILGHNGMGKTTLLKTLIGLVKTTDGSITFEGEAITREPPHKRSRRGIGYVPQGREIFPNVSVRDNLRLGFAVQKVDEQEVLEEVLEEFPRLKPLLDRAGRVLSGGSSRSWRWRGVSAAARVLSSSTSRRKVFSPRSSKRSWKSSRPCRPGASSRSSWSSRTSTSSPNCPSAC